MDCGVWLKLVWADGDLREAKVTAWAHDFSGAALIYLDDPQLVAAAAAIHGFPSTTSDAREFLLGEDESDAGGQLRMSFRCRTGFGHAEVGVLVRSGEGPWETRLSFPIEAAAVDRFTEELRSVARHATDTASLIGTP